MSWPSNDFEYEIQQRVDQLEAENKKYRDLFKTWAEIPEESRQTVIKELADTADEWAENAEDCSDNEAAVQDAVTLRAVVNIIKAAP